MSHSQTSRFAYQHRAPGLAALLGTCLLLLNCVSTPTREDLIAAPPPHLSAAAPAGIVDSQGTFRQLFCAALSATAGEAGNPDDCEAWLFRLPDEKPAPLLPKALPEFRGRVAIIPGAFSECFGAGARPFGDAPELIQSDTVQIEVVPVDGRSGTEHNAAQIAAFLKDWQDESIGPLILIGYSKGISDALQFLVDYPQQASRVSAVVSVAGSVRGSPLADRFGTLYDLLFSHLPSGHCETGDRAVVDSLRTGVRGSWLAENSLPGHIRYYSLAAFTDRQRLARSLLPSWEVLLGDGTRNDGQLLPEDALVPGSALLGYLYADHWGAVMELERDMPILLHRRDPATFPHTALLQAILQQVALDLDWTD